MSPSSRSHWTWRQFFTCLGVSIGMLGFSYPADVIATTLGQPSFLLYMKLLDFEGKLTPNANALIGAMSGLFQAGGIIGIFALSYINDRYGRRAAMWCCGALGVLGGTLLCAAQNVGMFIAFRFVAGAGAWAFLSIAPTYCAELAPPGLRGLFVGMCGFFVGLGFALGNYMGLAFYSTHGNVQWRGQYAVTVFINLVLVLITFLTPESPRWLLLQDRSDDAKRVVQKLYGETSDHLGPATSAELYQMQQQIAYDRTQDSSWPIIFRRPSYRKRAFMTIGYGFFGQCTGAFVINNYGSLLYTGLGYGPRQTLSFQCGYTTTGAVGNLLGAFMMDRVGRKPLMIVGIGGCLLFMSIYTALLAEYASPVPKTPNKAGLGGAVAMLYCFVLCYGIGVDAAGYVFWSEIFPNHIRAKGLALGGATITLVNLVFLQASPTAFASIGWKFYLLFICISAIGVFWVIAYLPETKGAPLEEVAAIFGDSDEVIVHEADVKDDPARMDEMGGRMPETSATHVEQVSHGGSL